MGHPIPDPPKGASLRRVEDDSGITGFTIDGLEKKPLHIDLPYQAALREMRLEDDSEFNLLRIDGLAHVISSLWTDDPVNTRYRLEDAVATTW